MKRINPATEEALEVIPEHGQSEIHRRLHRAAEQFRSWSLTTPAERSRLMRGAAALLRERSHELSILMTREMGKPITAAEAEVEKCAACLDHFADHAASYLAPRQIASDATSSYVRFDPLGNADKVLNGEPHVGGAPDAYMRWNVFRSPEPAGDGWFEE